MSQIIKYTALCFSAIIIIAFAVIFIGKSDIGNKAISGIGINDEEKIKKQNQQEDTSEQYRMYFNFEGDKSQIIDLIKGKAEINLVYPGKSSFTAKLLYSDGTLLAILADVNGPYNLKQSVDVPETGPYLLDVRTSGEWSLSRE